MTMPRSLRILSLALGLWLSAAMTAGACAQPPAGGEPMPRANSTSAGASAVEVGPPIYWLPDEDGNLQPVLGFRLEDFEAFLAQQDSGARLPQYTLEWSASGNANGERAELTLDVRIETQSDGWVRVPLGLSETALAAPAEYEGPGRHLLSVDPKAGGLVAWVLAESEQEHQLTLLLECALGKAGEESLLALTLPEAAFSELNFNVPESTATARVTRGGTLMSSEAAESGGTRLTVRGAAGPFELVWSAAQEAQTELPPVLEARGDIAITVDGRSVTSEARLTVGPFGEGSFDAFRVRLPPSARLVPRLEPGITFTEVATSLSEANPGGGSLVDVRLAEEQSEPLEVSIVTERAHAAAGESAPIELGGFEVLGAARQTGQIQVRVLGDWQLVWQSRRNVRATEIERDADAAETSVTAFEYLGQPCSLTVQIVPRETLLSVEQSYVVDVSADRVELDAELDYLIRGAKAFAVDVDLADWEIDEVGPLEYVDLAGLVLDNRAPLSIPLLQPTTGELKLRIRAHRDLDTGDDRVDFSLPRPHANSIGPASVTILAADNVVLTPQSDAIVGLTRRVGDVDDDLPPRQQRALSYRGDPRQARFVARMRVESRRLLVSVDNHVVLNESGGDVEQALHYDVDYAPVEALLLDVPPELLDQPGFGVWQDGEELQPTKAVLAEAAGERRVPMQVALRSPRIGSCDLVVRFPLDWEPLPLDASAVREVPLVMPTQGELASHRTVVTGEPGIDIQLHGGGWAVEPFPHEPDPAIEALRLRTSERTTRLELRLSLRDRRPFGGGVVDRLWLQSTFDGQLRNDRAVYRVTTPEGALKLRLPRQAVPAGLQAWVDGVRSNPSVTADGEITLPLPLTDPPREHVVEISYNAPAQNTSASRLRFEPPRVVGDVWVRRGFWQVVLPAHRHLVSSSTGYTPEFSWRWNGWGWSRVPLANQYELESWMGAAHAAAPPQGTNRYLFSVLSMPEPIELVTLNRTWLVLAAGGSTLLLIGCLAYVPRLRHPAVLVAVAALVAGAVVLWPSQARLIGQVALLGVGCLLVGLIVQRALAQRRRGPATVWVHGSSIVELGSTERQLRMPSTSSAATGSHTEALSAVGSGPTEDA